MVYGLFICNMVQKSFFLALTSERILATQTHLCFPGVLQHLLFPLKKTKTKKQHDCDWKLDSFSCHCIIQSLVSVLHLTLCPPSTSQEAAGQWSSGAWTARWASTAAGGTTGTALATCTLSSGWETTTYTTWAARPSTASESTCKTGATNTSTLSTRASGHCTQRERQLLLVSLLSRKIYTLLYSGDFYHFSL